MNQIDRQPYMEYSLELTPSELAMRDQFVAWLPETVIDCHAHCNLREHVLSISERTKSHMLSTFPYFSLEESEALQRLLYPGKKVQSLRFPKTFRGIDHRAANEYLLDESGPDDRVAVFGLPEDIPYTLQMLAHPRASALKMYYSYLEPPATRIYEYFVPEALEEAQARGLPIILHTPRIVSTCLDDILQVVKDFPRLRMVLAHLGLPMYIVPGLRETYEVLAGVSENVFMDTSLNASAEVIDLALSVFGSERIMYGSDEPLNLVRARVFNNPERGQRLITSYPYHWVDIAEHEKYKEFAVDVTHMHWQSLNGLRSAIDHMGSNQQEAAKDRIFYKNAKDLFGF